MGTILDPSGDPILDPSGDPITDGAPATLTLDAGHLVVHGGTLTPAAPAPTLTLTTGHIVVHGGTIEPPVGVGFEQFIDVTGATSGPTVGNPLVTRPGEIIPAMRAYLYHRPDLTNPVAELDQAWGHTFQEQLRGFGTGEITLGNEDPDLANVWNQPCIVRFEIHGRPAFTALIEEIEHVAISSSEESGQTTRLAGRGHLAILEEAVVYPPRGVDEDPFTDGRLFSWPSVDYDDTFWTTPQVITAVQGNTTPAWYGIADAWPDPQTQWVWAMSGTERLAPGGTCYYRQRFLLPVPLRVRIYFVADDIGDLWLDGEIVITGAQWTNTSSDVQVIDIDLSDGIHTLAANIANSPDAADIDGPFNPAALAYSVHALDFLGQENPTPIAYTGAATKTVSYPPGPPGMTPGEVIRHCVTEAQARGCFPELTLGFNDYVDSNGNPWEERTDISTAIGTNLATFFLEEMGSTTIDLWMAPGSFELHAYRHGERGGTRSVTLHGITDETNQTTGNLAGLTHHTVR